MAKDGLFPRIQGEVSARSQVPVLAVLTQMVWASLLALTGTFDQLTNCLLFVSWIFYGLVCAAVIVLRRTHPDAPRPYKVWGYPVTPAVFVVAAGCLTVNTFVNLPKESIAGLVLLALGIPVYVYFAFLARRPATRAQIGPSLPRKSAAPQ
jgi:APA family basic amino acid/polyamine antiporter